MTSFEYEGRKFDTAALVRFANNEAKTAEQVMDRIEGGLDESMNAMSAAVKTAKAAVRSMTIRATQPATAGSTKAQARAEAVLTRVAAYVAAHRDAQWFEQARHSLLGNLYTVEKVAHLFAAAAVDQTPAVETDGPTHYDHRAVATRARELGNGYSEAVIELKEGDSVWAPGSTKYVFVATEDGTVSYLLHPSSVQMDGSQVSLARRYTR